MPEVLKRGMRNLIAIDTLISRLESQGFYEDTKFDHVFSAAVEDAVIYFQQTHLGPAGLPLVVDGIVGPTTWWALKHPSGKAQKSHLKPKLPRGITGARLEVLALAIVEHSKNVREIPNGSNRSKEIDKYFPQWLQDKLGPSEKGPAWCCFSANWIFHNATGYWACGKRTGSCATMAKWADEQNIWLPLGSIREGRQIIRPGDFFVILHPRKPNKPATGHIGIVGSVNKNQTLIGTYEGNCGNRFKHGKRAVDQISGIINPYALSCQPTDFERFLPKVASVAGDGTR